MFEFASQTSRTIALLEIRAYCCLRIYFHMGIWTVGICTDTLQEVMADNVVLQMGRVLQLAFRVRAFALQKVGTDCHLLRVMFEGTSSPFFTLT